MKKNTMTYPGFNEDTHGMTVLGRVVLDGWLFGFIPESEDCKGWDMARMQVLMNRVEAAWDQHLHARHIPALAILGLGDKAEQPAV